uniref:Bcl2 modifying factor 2 n=2 Tax=Nothobranchius TaxID=28779 RepID=A0A1A8IW53_NOTKU
MDDEEEDMSRPTSQLWGSTPGTAKYEDRALQMSAGQALAAAAVVASHGRNNNSISSLPCSSLRPPLNGNAGLHFRAPFVLMEDRGDRRRRVEGEEDDRGEGNDRMAARPEEQPGVSVEVEIGRKLREIGDKFHQDHVEVFMRHQRQNLPAWMRLTVAIFGFLFPREAFIPRLRGEQR